MGGRGRAATAAAALISARAPRLVHEYEGGLAMGGAQGQSVRGERKRERERLRERSRAGSQPA